MNPEKKKWFEILDKDDHVLRRLEMIRLLRSGTPPEEIAEQFNTDMEYVYRINASFSLNGVTGILSDSPMKNWPDRLDKEDLIIKRLELIRLLRSGTPPDAIAKEFHTSNDYIQRLDEMFSQNGVIGILTEEDFQKFRDLYPEIIRICTFNLHGVQKNDHLRYKRISQELSRLDPDLCAFQEVISGNGIEETSAQIAMQMSEITGYHYQTFYAYNHLFMDKYPEGVSVAAKFPLKKVQGIDLNHGLRDGIKPAMERYAAAAEIEIYGQRIIFTSLHLDHDENMKVRQAQAEKLLQELESLYGDEYYCSILAGDFNDVEHSDVVKMIREDGYKDSYRKRHKSGGNTYTTSNPFTRIDYIMVKGDVDFLSAELVLDDPELSDHIGIYAVIK